MALEIERKYLVRNDSYKQLASTSYPISQGYLCRNPERTVRVRIKGEKGYLTVKGKNAGAIRAEFEYEIGVEDAREMLRMCEPPLIEKIRYVVPFEGHEWEVDEFRGARSGMITAEIELKSESEHFTVPSFIGLEVTGNATYYNSNL